MLRIQDEGTLPKTSELGNVDEIKKPQSARNLKREVIMCAMHQGFSARVTRDTRVPQEDRCSSVSVVAVVVLCPWTCMMITEAHIVKMVRHNIVLNGEWFIADIFMTLGGAIKQWTCNASLADSATQGTTTTPAPVLKLSLLLETQTGR